MGFLVSKDSINKLVKHFNNKFARKGANVYNTEDINVASNKCFNAGNTGNTSWSGFQSHRLCNNKQISASYGVGVAGGEGYAQLNWDDKTNNLNTRLLLNYNTFIPSYTNRVDLGTDAIRFKNGYFEGSLRCGNGTAVHTGVSNGYGLFSFKNYNGSKQYGYLGKMDGNEDFTIRATGGSGHLVLNSDWNSNVRLGLNNTYVYSYFGDYAWKFCPSKDAAGSVDLGSDAERWNRAYFKLSPNVSSDKNLKEGIVYVNDKSNLRKKKQVIHNDDFYSFIKDDLKITKYNYKQTRDDIKDDVKTDILGFIAQDIAENNERISEILLTQNANGEYGYDMSSYITIVAGALQKALGEIETLKQEIEILKAP